MLYSIFVQCTQSYVVYLLLVQTLKFSAHCLWCSTTYAYVKLRTKSKFMFSNDKALSSIMGWNWITTCNYLGITTGKNVTFKMHNENLVSQVKFKWAWILTRKHLISATFYLYWIGIDQKLFTSLLSVRCCFSIGIHPVSCIFLTMFP